MNTLRNKVQLIGNLGNDPEIVNLESGKMLAKFSIATNESYKNANGDHEVYYLKLNLFVFDRIL